MNLIKELKDFRDTLSSAADRARCDGLIEKITQDFVPKMTTQVEPKPSTTTLPAIPPLKP